MSDKIKVLHVVGTMNMGGAETMLMNLYRNIDRKKIEFSFLQYVDNGSYYDDEIIKLGGKIIRLKPVRERGVLKAISDLKSVIEKEKYDVVHAHTLFNCGIAMIAAKRAGVKIRISHAHTSQETNFGLVKKIYYLFMNLMIKYATTKYVGVSEGAGKFLFGNSIVNSNKYSFLPNFIEYKTILNNSNRKSIRQELGVDKNEFVIGNVGRFIPLKNQKLIIEIAKKLKSNNEKIKVLLVGDGDERENLLALVRKYNLEKEVIFTGYRTDTDNLLGAMDIFIFPSLFEGFGMVGVEAQVAGLPCIVSSNLPKEIDLELGLIERVSLNDAVEKWVDAVTSKKDKRELDKRKIEKALVDVSFTKEKIIEEFYKLYEII
ncbi:MULTISPECIES: glycosyltransferase family 1 protein [Psychrilyobacter]|uniref:Glycosyltransferase n=1 Tax=Psychrilyobacter piezotolerans TaxID=2293438 RepID=A0ABX9KHR4_9FUSO|nr:MULTISPECIES: glycosyltransferase family 1 protein [Psychrilyobacter]MCS5420923.1 glycosyltransferase family 1 protein [Psychrilyobacter sp. S5]NDI77673.1 glycosyltransferase family 1 protein [Psychrilyobacter piezotolerans]RDE62679.1 glycosyltransferase family 1 protein [Psychrilyobacter sp. S5]REI41609.1 glycosyltransferase [Psychrilyobacter piezotolerans]